MRRTPRISYQRRKNQDVPMADSLSKTDMLAVVSSTRLVRPFQSEPLTI